MMVGSGDFYRVHGWLKHNKRPVFFQNHDPVMGCTLAQSYLASGTYHVSVFRMHRCPDSFRKVYPALQMLLYREERRPKG